MAVDIREIKECPDCGSMNIVHNHQKHQVICRDCGLIFEQPALKGKRKS